MQALRDQPQVHGQVASTATIWRVLDGVDAAVLADLRMARARARARAWAARGELTGIECRGCAGRELDYAVIDVDATLITCHSDGAPHPRSGTTPAGPDVRRGWSNGPSPTGGRVRQSVVRHEALQFWMEVRGLRRLAVAAVG
ncbi:MAG: hypothetical protein ACR2I7_06330 [Geodermatophilaceae bacterium]